MAPKKKKRPSLKPPPPLVIDEQRTTPAMRRALSSLRSSLLCPLCNQVLRKPSTLSCAHTFCYDCIDDFMCNAWTCPAVGCGMPVTANGSRPGSYLKVNPQYETVVTSFDVICNALNKAPEQWWKEDTPEEVEDVQTGEGERYGVKRSHSTQDDDTSVEENENEEVVDFSSIPSKQDQLASSPAFSDDSQKTQEFPSKACPLPSQSPGRSPIPHMDSQLLADTSISTRKSVSFVKTCPQFVVVSKLSAKDQKVVSSLVNKQDVELLQLDDILLSSNVPSSITAVCGNPEMQTGDGFLVGRTFGYLWAVAAKLPIVHVSYLEQMEHTDDPSKHQVIGDAACVEWMAPQRSRESPIKLLEGFTVLLCGDFDTLPRHRKESTMDKLYTRTRVEALLSLCGARILQVETLGMNSQENNGVTGESVILIRPNPQRRDWTNALNTIQKCAQLKEVTPVIVCANWLLDSIADYTTKALDNYQQTTFKKSNK